MRKLFVLGLLLGLSHSALAEDVEIVKNLLSHTDTEFEISLNKDTVRCLVGNYGASSLKISVPELKHITILRHTTDGEDLPCINAGPCKGVGAPEGRSPSDILEENKPTERVSISVDRYEELVLDHKKKTCQRTILEEVFSKVRGLDFKHFDYGGLGNTSYEACLKLKEAARK